MNAELLLAEVRSVVAPEVPLPDYIRAVERFERTVRGLVTPHDTGVSVEYRFSGLERIRSELAEGHPVALVGWRHGAYEHLPTALHQVLPAVVGLEEPGREAAADKATTDVGWLREALTARQPAFLAIDDPPSAPVLEGALLGLRAQFTFEPLRALVDVEGARVMVVTARFGTPATVYVRFHDPMIIRSPAYMAERQLLQSILDRLTVWLSRHAPEQVRADELVRLVTRSVQLVPRPRAGRPEGTVRPPAETLADSMEAKEALRQQAWRAVHRVLAPERAFQEYSRAVREFRAYVFRVERRRLPEPSNDRGRMSYQSDNSASFEPMTFEYQGLDVLDALAAKGERPCLVLWHHGARDHLIYGLGKLLPDLAVFTNHRTQFGRVVSQPIKDLGPLALLEMRSALRRGKPLAFYLDGLPSGRAVPVELLGLEASVSTGPLTLLSAEDRVRIVPVGSYYLGPRRTVISLHRALPPIETGAGAIDGLLTAAIGSLTDELRARAPEQVLPNFMAHRESWRRERLNAGHSGRP